jgi:hypothetical protein
MRLEKVFKGKKKCDVGYVQKTLEPTGRVPNSHRWDNLHNNIRLEPKI